MNPRSLILVATLGANCALAAMLLRSPPTPPATSPAAEAGQPASASTKSKSAASRVKDKADTSAAADPAPAPPSFHWASIESEDFKKYIQNLRDLGVPDETIRDLIRAEVTKMYRPKMLALRTASNPANYWERNFGNPFGQTAEQRKQQQALYKEQNDLLKELLGESPLEREHPLMRVFTNASPEVLKQITELQTKMYEKQQALRDKTGGYMDSSSMADRRKVEREFYDEVAKLTSPEQVEAYKLRNSDFSRQLRNDLRAFSPTEEEFKAIFHQLDAASASQPAAAPSDGPVRMTAEQLAQQRDARAKADAALAEVLGPERAKEYKLLSGYEYNQLAESGVAKESLLRLAEMKTAAETAARNIPRDTTLSPEQRAAALLAIRTETEKELAVLLGERRAKAYPNSGGYWIRNLAPTVTTRVVTP
ncbi:MAG: hypothetical protein HZA92_10565 [Verrucomicrobia bacterium]|nr:hypothetical protein [Verrucomicrobiota bacterium]